MLDLGWSEMAVIALLALLVIGPKDLPRVLRTLGQFMRKARSLSREFQSGLDEMMRETELDEARRAIERTRPGQLDREIRKAIDPGDEVEKELRDMDRDMTRAVRDDPGRSTAAKPSPAAPAGEQEKAEPAAGKVVRHPAGAGAADAKAASAAPETAAAEAGATGEAPEGPRKSQQTG